MAKKQTIGGTIDALYRKKEELAEANQVVKRIKEEMDALERQLMEMLGEQDTTQGRGALAVASINEKSYPEVEDWDKFYQYIHENRFYHLLQRRPSQPACDELFTAHGEIPGVVKFTKKVVNLRGI